MFKIAEIQYDDSYDMACVQQGIFCGINAVVSFKNLFVTVIMLPRNYFMSLELYNSICVCLRSLGFLTSVCILETPTALTFL